jgi:hypothetical protein
VHQAKKSPNLTARASLAKKLRLALLLRWWLSAGVVMGFLGSGSLGSNLLLG